MKKVSMSCVLLMLGLASVNSLTAVNHDLYAKPPNFSHIVAPSTATLNDNVTVYVHVEDTTPSSLPQSVVVSLLNSSNGSIARDGPKTVLSGSFKRFVLETPIATEADFGQFVLEVTMTTHTNSMVKRILPLKVRYRNKILMLQTDKPIYKPGETVMGRVIGLTGDMKSATGEVTVTIQNPQSYTIGKFSNISLYTGVGEFEMPLSKEAVLGTYRVCATYQDPPQNQACFSFEVKRYSQYVFYCSITPADDIVAIHTRKICFSVTATYTNTYRNKVKGIMSATVRNGSRLRPWCKTTGRSTVSKKIDGRAHVCVSLNKLDLCTNEIVIEATVTDLNSDTTVQCKQGNVSVIIPYTYNKLEIEEERSFTPCHYTTVKVFASTLTGTPKYANVTLMGYMYKQNADKLWNLGPFYQITDRSGLATFRICTSCQALKLYFTAEVEGVERAFFPRAISNREMMWAPGRIELSTKEKQIQVGNTATITASFSQKRNADYYVVRRGQIVDHGRCVPRSDRNAYRRHPELCNRHTTTPITHTCYISFRVTSSMAPKFTVIVVQKDVAASRIIFDVIQEHTTQVSLEFEEEEVQPGDETTLLVRAPPMSFVGIVAVDRNVYGMKEKNQLTYSKIYEHVRKFDEDQPMPLKSYICQWDQACECQCYRDRYEGSVPFDYYDCCHQNCTNVPRFCYYFYSLSSYFFASGIQMSDSDSMFPTQCPEPKLIVRNKCCHPGRRRYRSSFFDRHFFKRRRSASRASNSVQDGQEEFASLSLMENHMPETWLWFHLSLGNNDSFAAQRVTVPNAITSWVTDAFAVSQSTAMTIARPATLKVFKPFFVTINLPFSVIRGELAEITLTVFNYMQNDTTAFVELLVNDNELRVVRSKSDRTLKQGLRQTKIAAGDSTTITYLLLSLQNGYLPIKATARSQVASDSAVRHLFVEPEGVKEEYSQSSLLCVESNSSSSGKDLSGSNERVCISRQFKIELPPTVVPNSESAAVSIAANYMGPTIKGMEHLLTLPTGCGEQSLLVFASAVYIARYLDAVKSLSAETRADALRFMQTGYQKEMTYQREDGSFSAFGGSDDCGSVWLTSFVLRIFSQADGLIGMYIDPKVRQDAIGFIVAQQESDGSFPSVCKPTNKDMLGCGEGNCSLTAYVTLSLLEAGVSPENRVVRRALANLLAHCIPSNCDSPFSLALMAYTLSKANLRTPARVTALRLLKQCAVTKGNQTYWQGRKSCRAYCRPQSCDIETNAYALLTFVSKSNFAYSSRIARWLIEQRNSRGGFKSTQDTVVALQALSEYATLTASDYIPFANVSLSAVHLNQSIAIDSVDKLQVETVQLPRIPTSLDIKVCGVGCISASVGVTYYVARPDESATFDVGATATKFGKRTCKYQVEVCNRWTRQDPETSNMAVTEVTFFSGFQPIQSELKQLRRRGQCMTKRTEFEGRVLSIYFDEINQTQCCFNITMKRVSLVKYLHGVPVITYDYYEPDQRGGTMLYPRQDC